MKTKLTTLLLGAATVLSLAACGGQAVTAPDPTAAPTPVPQATEQAVPTETPAPIEEAEPTEAPAVTEPEAAELVYGTATLTYAEYYAGDVSSVESYDAVSSATNSKHSIFPNISTDFVDADTNAGGYRILGVANVPVAVPADQLEAYQALNPSFVPGDETAQYKPVTVEDGAAVYAPTEFDVLQTVENARAELKTSSNWGDYEIDIFDNEGDDAANLLRRDREDAWPINSEIQGVILETEDGFQVGLEYLQSIWVQPYEVSFNVSAESTSNAHIAVGGAWDNIPELSKLVGKTVTKITYLMPEGAYVYLFDGIYIKPAYDGEAAITATPAADSAAIAVDGIPSDLVNPTVTVVMGTGRGRSTLVSGEPLSDGAVVMRDADGNEAVYDPSQTYAVTVSSDNYADIAAAVPMSQGQREQLEALIAQAEEVLAEHEDEAVLAHKEEAEALLTEENPVSADAAELISELTGHLSVYAPAEEGQNQGGGQGGGRGENGGGHGGQGGGRG